MKRRNALLGTANRRLRQAIVLAIAASLVLSAQAVLAQGLSYQKATDFPANIFPETAYISASVDNDGRWGLRTGFGTQGPFGTGEVWQAGVSEDVPELTQVVSGLTPGASYDLYAAYWTDDDENWPIRAGVQPGNLTLYSFNGNHRSFPVSGSTIGSPAGAAIWSSLPPPTGSGSPFFQTRESMEPFGDPLVMLLGYAGRATANPSGEINVYVDDLPFGGGANRTWFDGVAYRPATDTALALTTSINRDTGAITVHNPTPQNFQIQSYFVDSVGGALNASQWSTINATNPSWMVTATPDPSAPYATSFSEDGGGNLVTIPAGGSLSFGNAWRKTPIEDVRIYLTLADGTLAVFSPEYTGTPAVFGDLNGDGIINIANDYQTLLNNLHTSLAGLGLTAVERYQRGDLIANSVVNFFDFAAFRQAYNQANGAGSFDAIVAGVPEPSSLLLLCLMGAAFFGLRQRRLGGLALAITVCCLLGGTSQRAFAVNIAIDIDSTRLSGTDVSGPIATQPGYTSWNLTDVGTSGSMITVDDVTFEIFGLNAANQSRIRLASGNPNGGGGAFNNLAADFVFNEGADGRAIALRISGLPVGTYFMNTWHADQGVSAAEATQVEVRNFNEAQDPSHVVVTGVPWSTSVPIEFQLDVTSPGQVREVIFRESSATNRARLNGFSLFIPEALTLEVNTATGAMRFVNEQATNFDMSYYEIRSISGSLNLSGWSPLGGPPVGTGWDSVPNSSENLLSEVNLQSSSSLGPGASLNLGSAFSVGESQDVRFFYAAPGETALRSGIVRYVTVGGLQGDYNNDGKVDAADYVLWRKTGINGQDGYNTWRANFGAMAGSGAGAAGAGAVSAVPEPASLMLLLVAVALSATWRRR